jgi:type III pantothenate kinase
MPKRLSIDPLAPVIVVDIGNTSTDLGTWQGEQVKSPLAVPTNDLEAFARAFDAHRDAAPKRRPAAVVIASVVPEALGRAKRLVSDEMDREALVVGDSIPLPMDVEVLEPELIGVDRVCGAFAAWATIQQACTIVSFGTCVTIDVVSDEGSLLGGAILPGMRMQLQAMHEHTAVLPEVEPGVPLLPYGRTTTEAMQTGAVRGLAGAVRGIVEGYATHLNRWPQVIATGGDASFFQAHCDFIDTFVSHLVLRGVGLAYSKHLAEIGAG